MSNTANELDDLLQRSFRYALALTHDAGSAEDLLQDACLAVARKGGPWRIEYVFSVIRNKFIDGRRRDRILRFRPLDGPGHDVAFATQPSPGDDHLDDALGRLRPEERELLFLHAVEGRTAGGIAEITGRSRGTILSALHRAKKKVREHLDRCTTRKIS